MDVQETVTFDLAELAGAEDRLSPALRAAIERVYAPESAEGPGGFNSFVDADL